MKYRFIHYWDVWGNADEGFEVNDVATLGDVDLDVHESDTDEEAIKKVAKSLDKWFDTDKLLKAGLAFDRAICDDQIMELIFEREDGAPEPFGRLEKRDESHDRK